MNKVLLDNDLDALIATTPENVAYASGHDSHLPRYFHGLQEYVVLTRESGALIIPAVDLAYLAARPSWIKDIWTYGSFFIQPPAGSVAAGPETQLKDLIDQRCHLNSVVEALIDVLKKMGITGSRVGLDEDNFSTAVRRQIEDTLPGLRLVDASDLFKFIRVIKTEDEINRLRQAANANMNAFQVLVKNIREGATEHELMCLYRLELVKHEAMPALISNAAGTRSAAPFLPPTSDSLKSGDIFRFDGTAYLNSYWTDFGRTVVLGEPSEKTRSFYNAIMAGFEEGLKLVKSGQQVAELFNAVVETVRESGIEQYRRHHVGHGIGVEIYDPPILEPKTDAENSPEGSKYTILEENMVICLEVPYYELGFGGMQIEDTLLVTSDGYERLITLDKDLYIR
jgi:Xaa-Pro aminopeptidase